MEVGSAAESVTVTEAAPLLKTESGELSNTVATKTMDTLPLLSVGQNSSGIRNPFNLVALLPGAFYQPSPSFTGPTVRINGGVAGSEKLLVDGMDGTNILGQGANQQNQPGMDSIQEWTVQTSNYSAEFGQAGSAVMNVTMKSGTNQYHGSLYEYFQNDVLNAAQPFTVQKGSPNEHNRPTVRRNDYGLTLGGPVEIPKVYNGRDKTFFFFSWEQFLQNQNFLPGTFTVPTAAYRNGDFSAAITAAGNKNLGTDPTGRTDPCQHDLRSAHAADRAQWPDRHQSIRWQPDPSLAVRSRYPEDPEPDPAAPLHRGTALQRHRRRSEFPEFGTRQTRHRGSFSQARPFVWAQRQAVLLLEPHHDLHGDGLRRRRRASAHLRHVRRRHLFASRAPEL